MTELLAIGAGPSNLALAVALEELAPDLADRTLVVEQRDDVSWQNGMLLPWARTQVSFLKDLVTLRNPQSRFTFLSYLHAVGRLDEFVNLGSFTPYRIEVSDYLCWVANALRRVRIDYGRRCVGIAPDRSADGGIDGWRARFADGGTVDCRDLVIGAGREPRVPDVFAGLPAERLVHSTEYRDKAPGLERMGARRVVVVGGAQSAVELLWASHQLLPDAECTLVSRSAALRSYEHSKFANEIYYPSYVSEFFHARPAAREQVLDQLRGTNYGAADPELLDTVYRQRYLDRVTGTERLNQRMMTDIVDARFDGSEVVLRLVDRATGAAEELRCDAVLLGTGFSDEPPALVRGLLAKVGMAEATLVGQVSRNYRLALPRPGTATCYLQGINERTHGISDSLLSVLAVRSEQIVADLLDRRDRRQRAATADLTGATEGQHT
jgi:L-ornithine N5-oxygenase